MVSSCGSGRRPTGVTRQPMSVRGLAQYEAGSALVCSTHKLVPDRIPNQLRIILHASLFKHPGAVGAYRLDAEVQLLSDLAYRLARGHHLQDLELAVRKDFVHRALGFLAKV